MILPKQVDFGAETKAIAITDFSGRASLANESSNAPESLSESSLRSHARRAALPSIRYVESRWPNFPSLEDCRHGDHSPWLPHHKHDQILPGTLRRHRLQRLALPIFAWEFTWRAPRFVIWNSLASAAGTKYLSICRRSQSERSWWLLGPRRRSHPRTKGTHCTEYRVVSLHPCSTCLAARRRVNCRSTSMYTMYACINACSERWFFRFRCFFKTKPVATHPPTNETFSFREKDR